MVCVLNLFLFQQLYTKKSNALTCSYALNLHVYNLGTVFLATYL